MSLKYKIVSSCFICFIAGVAVCWIWKQPILIRTRINTKIILIDSVYAEAKYAIGDEIWHFTYKRHYPRHYPYDGKYRLTREWEADTVKKITITKNKIFYNGYEETELFDIDDSTQALCKIYQGEMDSLTNKMNKINCE